MSAEESRLARSARELRDAFDRSFAEPPGAERPEQHDFLAIEVAGDRYALRLTEITGLYADQRLARVASPLPELIGVAGFRGVLAPVYDLGALLGYRAGSASRFLVLVRARAPLALSFDAFLSHVRVGIGDLAAPAEAGGSTARSPHVRAALQALGVALPVLDLPSIVEGVIGRIKAHGPVKEG